jgi:hypothetical protein
MLLCLLALGAACSPGAAPTPTQEPPSPAAPAPTTPPQNAPATPSPPVPLPAVQRDAAFAGPSISDLNAKRPTSGRFTLLGYVSKVYLCPPCPQGAQCKPCMGDNIVLSDAPRRIDSYGEMGAGDVIVFGDRAAIEADVRQRRTTSQPLNDLELAAATPSP